MAEHTGRTNVLAGLVALEGLALTAAGGLAWLMVRRELADARITVEDDAEMLAGHKVAGPLSAYVEARVIDRHALEATGGKTFAELGAGDEGRDTAKDSSFMRASLFTSVMAFGVAALAMAVEVALVIVAFVVRSGRR
jgi:hypothetical protein